MDIRMQETADGSPDGVTVERYYEDHTYRDVPQALAEQFINAGVAKPLGDEDDDAPIKPDERETKPSGPTETKPETPDEEKDPEDRVSVEKTAEDSPYYHVKVDGEPLTDDDGEAMSFLGEDNARNKADEVIDEFA